MKINAYQGQSTNIVDLIFEGRPIYDKNGEYDGDEGNFQHVSIDSDLHLPNNILYKWGEIGNGDFMGDITIDADTGDIRDDGGFEKEYNLVKSVDPNLAQTLLKAFLKELEDYVGINEDSYWIS